MTNGRTADRVMFISVSEMKVFLSDAICMKGSGMNGSQFIKQFEQRRPSHNKQGFLGVSAFACDLATVGRICYVILSGITYFHDLFFLTLPTHQNKIY